MSIIYVEGEGGYTTTTQVEGLAPSSASITGMITLFTVLTIATGDPKEGIAPAVEGVGGGVPGSGAPLAVETSGMIHRPAPLEIEVGATGEIDPAPLAMQIGGRAYYTAPVSDTITGQTRRLAPNSIATSRPSPGDPAPLELEITKPVTSVAPETVGLGGREEGQAPASLEVQGGESAIIIIDIASEVIAGARGDNCP